MTYNMRIVDLLDVRRIAVQAQQPDKAAVLEALVRLQATSGDITDVAAYRRAVWEREAQLSTGMERGIAVPHAKSDSVQRPCLAAMTLRRAVPFDALDGKPCDVIFMIAAPVEHNRHIEILAHLMGLLTEPGFGAALRAAQTPREFLDAIDRAETARYGPSEGDGAEDNGEGTERRADAPDDAPAGGEQGSFAPNDERQGAAAPRVVAVTACPAGLAHTYLAAEALEQAAQSLHLPVKVETDGSAGVKNALTAGDIAGAVGVLVAADRRVDTDRFAGKPVVFVSVADAIAHPARLLQQAARGDAPLHCADGPAVGGAQGVSSQGVSSQGGEGRAKQGAQAVYRHLMSGVSYMLPFVIGGGILMALAYLLDTAAIDPANFGANTPLAAFFKAVGSAAFRFMLPVLAGYIAYSIAGQPGLAVGFVGGYLAAMGNTFDNLLADGTVSGGFLAALLAGFAAGYVVVGLRAATRWMPARLASLQPVLIYPVAGMLLIGVLLFAVNPVIAALNTRIIQWLNGIDGTGKVALGCLLGGMMSVDMGGPINKAAYVFGTASIALGHLDVMAAVMVGGMVPPLAVALCTTFFKRKFTRAQREAGVVNYLMGLCFITEGAIPFAAADPLRVLPSCVAGSAVAGGLAMAFGCTLSAPHGGIFVFPLVGHPVGYGIALAAGAVVGCVLMGVLKPNVAQEGR